MTVYERGAQLQAGGEPDSLAPAADRYVPLSAAQRSIWFAQQLAPGTAFSIAQYVDVSGELDTYLLTDAGRQVAREFGTGMVRLVPASIVADGDNPTGAPFQAIDDEARVEFIDLDLRTESDPEAAARAWMDDEFRGPLDLFADRLLVSVTLRIADRRWFWYSRSITSCSTATAPRLSPNRWHRSTPDGSSASRYSRRVRAVWPTYMPTTSPTGRRPGSSGTANTGPAGLPTCPHRSGSVTREPERPRSRSVAATSISGFSTR